MKKAVSLVITFLLIMVPFPTVSLAADAEITSGGTYDIGSYYNSGDGLTDTLTISTTQAVTLTNTGSITATNFQIVCSAGTNVTLNGVTIDNSSYVDACPLSFTGSGNTLSLASGTASTLAGTGSAPGVRVESGTALTIDGSGSLNAQGTVGAGIGGGSGCDGGTIIIGESAVVTVQSSSGAGLGGGADGNGGTVNISGSASVTATAITLGAGIGGGFDGDGGTVNISGTASVTATATDEGAGIGGGSHGDGGNVTITGGTIVANGGFGYDIGSGAAVLSGGTLRVDGAANLMLDDRGTDASVTIGDAYIRDDSASSPITDGYYVNGSLFTGEVIDVSGTSSGTGYTYSSPVFTVNSDGAYLIMGATTVNCVTVASGVVADIVLFGTSMTPGSGCAFDITGSSVNLELAGSSTLQSSSNDCAGLQCPDGASVTISSSPVLSDGSSDGAVGSLTAKGGYSSAGIGGGNGENGGAIRIEGGTVNALGNEEAAAIGGGNGGTGGQITISGGTVTASGSWRGAGIGGGRDGDGGQIAITGGSVTARSEGPQNDSGGGAGIGGGQDGDGGEILISGGVVNAYGAVREYGCGIGGGMYGAGGTITISGGTVTAVGNKSGAGIGGNSNRSAGTIRITGGTVNATGGLHGAGIGGDGGTVAIEGGTVTAQSRWSGAGIGGNHETCVDTITISGGVVNAIGGEIATVFGAGAGIGTGGGYTLRGPFEGGSIAITGGTVTATGGSDNSAGIGGGWKGGAGTISVSGGTVYAAGNGGQDIGPGPDGAGGTLSISGTAAVFLKNDSCITPVTTTTHTHLTYTEDSEESYGYDIPSAWTPTFGAYLRLVTLSYNTNGGSGSAPDSVTQLYNTTSNAASGSGLSRTYYTFDGWNTAANGGGTGYTAGSSFTYTADTTLYAQWKAHPELTSSVANGKIYTGGRITLTPNIDGGTWDWDENLLSATFNSPATFTGLKAGVSTITYTVDGVSTTYDVSIEQSELPNTGQNTYVIWVLISAAGILLVAGMVIGLRKNHA